MIVEPYTNGFGGRLRVAMDARGVRKNVDLADAIGVVEGTIRNYLKMVYPPKHTRIITIIASHLNVRLNWLLHGDGPMVEGGVAEPTASYSSDIDAQLLGRCFEAILVSLDPLRGRRPSAGRIGAVMAEVYLLCQREGKQPTQEVVAPFIRVLLA